MSLENKIEKTLREDRGDKWVIQAKREARIYQQQLKMESLKKNIGSKYLTRKGSVVRLKEVKAAHTVIVEFPTGFKKEVHVSVFNTWVRLNETSIKNLSSCQQLSVQIHALQEQKRRINLQHLLPEDKALMIKGIDLSIQTLQNLQNPNNKW